MEKDTLPDIVNKDDIYIPIVKRNYFVHVVFWFAFFVYLIWEAGYDFSQIFTSIIDSLIYLGTTLITVYTNILILLPRYLYRRKYYHYALWLLAIVALSGIIKTVSYIYIIPSGDEQLYSLSSIFSSWFFKSLFETIAISSFQIIQDWATSQNYIKEMENQRLETELKFLKAQMQPHFLFNTLNNIFFLIKRDPERAEGSVLKLSELLRYRLYEASNQKVNINQEINYTLNYIELHKLRYGKEIRISVEITGTSELIVEPFVFMDFVENCFKHARPNKGKDVYIDIKFVLKPDSVMFYAANSINEEELKAKLSEGGIGLNNIKKRLEILYPDKHHLIIEDLLGKFIVQLEILK